MNTLEQITKETVGFRNIKSMGRYAQQSIVMTIAAKIRRRYKFECKEMTITLKDIWNAFKTYLKSLGQPVIKRTTATQPNLSSYYDNKPSNYYTGD